jgi:hypothetical protein
MKKLLLSKFILTICRSFELLLLADTIFFNEHRAQSRRYDIFTNC